MEGINANKYLPSAMLNVRNASSDNTKVVIPLLKMPSRQDISAKEFEVLPGLGERLSIATWGSFSMRSKPTSTMKEQIRIVREALPRLEKKLEEILYAIEKIETRNEAFGIPYVRGFED